MSVSEISPYGLPQNLKYDEVLPSVPDSLSSYVANIAASGLTIVQGATIDNVGSPTFVANGAGGVNQQFNNQAITFMIPSGQSSDLYIDTRNTMLSGRMVITITTAPVGTNLVWNLIGSFSSFFESLTLYSNNVPIEQIFNYNLLFNYLLNTSVNGSERYGSWSVANGADQNSFSGTDLPQSVGTFNYNFSIPLVSILGLNLSTTSNKLLPVGSIQNLSLQMNTSTVLPFASYCTAITTQPVYSVALDSFNLSLEYINIGEIFGSMLRGSLLDGKYFIKSQTYVGANANLPVGSFGNSTLSLNIRNSSIKSLFYYFAINKSAKSTSGYWDAINPNLISENLNIGGLKIPQTPLNMSQKPNTVYSALNQALGGQSIKSMGGILNRTSFGASLGNVAGQDSMIVDLSLTNNGTRRLSQIDATTQVICSFGNMNYHGIDLERISGGLFSGTNTRATGINMELTIATALTDNVTMYSWALSDVILKIDTQTKQIEVLI